MTVMKIGYGHRKGSLKSLAEVDDVDLPETANQHSVYYGRLTLKAPQYFPSLIISPTR